MLKETTSSADVDNLIITRYVAELKRNARLSAECEQAPTTTLTGAGAEMLNPVFTALDQSEKRLLARDLMLKYKRNNTRAKIINKSTSKIIIKRVLFIKKPKLKI